MATPGQIRDATLKDLRAAQRTMNNARWLLALEAADETTRKDAAIAKINVHHAIVKLQNTKLAEMLDKLKENEAALSASTTEMRQKIADLRRIKEAIDSIAQVLQVVGRILPLLVGL